VNWYEWVTYDVLVDDISPRVLELDQSTAGSWLWRVRARMPSRSFSFLLRAVGLHTRFVHALFHRYNYFKLRLSSHVAACHLWHFQHLGTLEKLHDGQVNLEMPRNTLSFIGSTYLSASNINSAWSRDAVRTVLLLSTWLSTAFQSVRLHQGNICVLLPVINW